jgi:hypothetical protein
MKTVLKLALALTLVAGSTALAGDDTKATDAKKANVPADKKAKKTQVANAKEKDGVLLTGSNIKQSVTRYGRITDGVNQVLVFDRKTIENSGASDLKHFLGQQGVR